MISQNLERIVFLEWSEVFSSMREVFILLEVEILLILDGSVL